MLQQLTMPLGAYQTNCYILWADTSDRCVVIDPGYEPETILSKLRTLGKRLEAILLTHCHFDHVGAVKELAMATDCKVYLCPEDLSMPLQFTGGQLSYTDTYGDHAQLQLAGLEIGVLHTPGHTPGSVCLWVEDSLFAGDTLFQESCGRTDLPGGDWSQIRRSLQRLRELPEQLRVYPGHGPDTTIAHEKQWNPYMR